VLLFWAVGGCVCIASCWGWDLGWFSHLLTNQLGLSARWWREKLKHRIFFVITDNVKALDVGLEEEDQPERGFGFFGSNGETGRHSSMVPRWSPPISYLHLYECEQFSVSPSHWCFFC
jgi:hypothetical protein